MERSTSGERKTWAALEISGLRKVFGGVVRARRRHPQHRPRPDPRHRRPQRLGQDDALQRGLTGVHKPTAGRVSWQGEEIAGRPAHEIARRGLVRTFQRAMVVSRSLGPRERAHRLRAWPFQCCGKDAGRHVARRAAGFCRAGGAGGDEVAGSMPLRQDLRRLRPGGGARGAAWRSSSSTSRAPASTMPRQPSSPTSSSSSRGGAWASA